MSSLAGQPQANSTLGSKPKGKKGNPNMWRNLAIGGGVVAGAALFYYAGQPDEEHPIDKYSSGESSIMSFLDDFGFGLSFGF